MMPATPDLPAFAEEWNSLDRSAKLRLRRLVRMGRPIEEPDLSRIAPAYARYQRSRPWMRYFWLWFVPGMLLVLLAAAGIHPIVVGIVIALGAQAVWAWFSLRRMARDND
jgi:hypothetical protein